LIVKYSHFRLSNTLPDTSSWSIRKTLNWMKNRYDDVSLRVRAGADSVGSKDDDYSRQYVNEVLKGV